MMRKLTVIVLLLALALASAPAVAAKNTSTNQAKLGTTQMSGENAKIGTTYTLGKRNPINVTLTKVEYTLEPVQIGTGCVWPKSSEKLMVLHYTLHNPNKQDYGLGWGTLEITAVDANDKNWRYCTNVAMEDTRAACVMSLKPAQKTKVYTCIAVPAQGEIPKVILESRDKLVLRYDLRGKVTPLPAAVADPADASGATAPENITAQMGMFYPMNGLHAKIDSAAFSTAPVEGKAPRKGSRYLVVIGTAKNNTPGKAGFRWSTFRPVVKDADGGEVRWNSNAYYASRDDKIVTDIEPGQELRFRYVFEAPENAQLKSLSLSQSGSHAYVYDLSQVQ